ncbi:MAG: translation initiation factor IF-2 [Desulfuromonadales bacterium]|nr:translation initiation factor IF-2 [Desulfuromonadales bacterium]
MREKKKTKVYELSRVLKLKETELISILETLGVEVSTKFSPLSDEDVDRVTAWCRKNQGPDVVEKRVGSGVRRRRMKVVEKPAPAPAAAVSSRTEPEVAPEPVIARESRPAASASTPSVTPEALPETAVSAPAAPDAALSAASAISSEISSDTAEALSSENLAAAPDVPAPEFVVDEALPESAEVSVVVTEKNAAVPDAAVEVQAEVKPETASPTASSPVPLSTSESASGAEEMSAAGEIEVTRETAAAAEESVSLAAAAPQEEAAAESSAAPAEKAAETVSEAAEKPDQAARKGKKSGPRGARVIGRVALSDLQEQSSGRPSRNKMKVKSSEVPAKVAVSRPVAPVEELDTAAKEAAALKKARKPRKKEGAVAIDLVDDAAGRSRKGQRRSVIKNLNFVDDQGGKGRRTKGSKKKVGQKTEITLPKEIKRVVKITDAISVGELAKKMGVKAGEVISKLMSMGSMVTINQMVDFDTATLVADAYGHTVENVAFDEDLVLERVVDKPEDLSVRPPVVTIMGHVDHGKTSLLDAIRLTRVADGEAGGITQHIGAYIVSLPNGNISFVDTPGHEAFTAMRSRGAGVTDIVILVVAADDGVMPTTVESINHAKAAGVPIIVAINKIDKENARPDEVRRQLSEYGLLSEEWGGDTIFVEVSAKKQINLDTLLEMILLQAEIMELTANPDKPAQGVVLESRLDRGKGPVATVLVQDGTVRQGDFIVAGLYSGRVRALLDDMGQQIDSAGPSIPVEVLGLNGAPSAGDDFNVVKSEKQAKELTANRQHKAREQDISKTSKISLEDLFEQMEEGEVEQLNVIVKGDVQGSVEAVSDALKKQATAKVKVEVVHAAVGGVKEADVMLAAASKAIIVAFNVRPDLKAQHLAEQENVDIRLYTVIYSLLEDLRLAMEGLLAPDMREVYLGRAEVRQAFMVSKVGMIAGCRVIDGKMKRNAQVRLLRDDVVIVEGKISSLKRFKDDAKEVASGFECGIGIENYNDIKPGDVIEAYVVEAVAAKL